jgi:hypothetical protein
MSRKVRLRVDGDGDGGGWGGLDTRAEAGNQRPLHPERSARSVVAATAAGAEGVAGSAANVLVAANAAAEVGPVPTTTAAARESTRNVPHQVRTMFSFRWPV